MTGGSGKTFLASAIGGELIKRYEASVRLVNASGLLDLSQEKHRDMQDPPGSLNACRVNNKLKNNDRPEQPGNGSRENMRG